MDRSSEHHAAEPLFASNERLWIRIWIATQTAALLVACYVLVGNAGGVRPFFAAPAATRSLVIVALLIAYHAAGFRAHAWMMAHRWSVYLFIPLGWAIILAASTLNGAFGLLILGAILQGFIFLPFASAIAALALVVVTMAIAIIAREGRYGVTLTVARLVGLVAMGTTFASVMLYIHRANRDAAVRSRLIARLDDAQRDLAERSRDAGVQEERQRLARDIHDTLAQGFTSVIKHLEAIELTFAAPGVATGEKLDRAMPHLENAQVVSRESLAEIRRLVWALRPPQLEGASLGAAIERFVAQWSSASGVPAECVAGPLPALRPDADVLFLRATQESLSNVTRHANAEHVSVSIHCVDGLVLLSVEDDGRGFADPEAVVAGKMGIVGMRERVRPFGGRVLIDSGAAGRGTSLTVAVPLTAIATSAA